MQQATQANQTPILIFQKLAKKPQCLEHNQVAIVCCSQHCKNYALMCLNQKCSSCQNNHSKCSFLNYQTIINRIIQKKQSLDSNQQKFIFQTKDKINQIIDQISQLRQNLIIRSQFNGLCLKQIDFIKKFFSNQQIQKINGNYISSLIKLKNQKQSVVSNNLTNVKRIKENIQIIRAEILKIQNNLTKKLSSNSLFSQQNKIILDQWFEQIKSQKPLEYSLVFKASENNFSIKKFYEKCSQIKNTIIMIKTQNDTLLGGFNPIDWSMNKNQSEQLKEVEQNFFVFNLSDKKYYVLQQNWCKNIQVKKKLFGFGGRFHYDYGKYIAGYDLIIQNWNQNPCCHVKSKGTNQIPRKKVEIQGKTVYQHWGGNKNEMILIKQYQVYEVIFGNEADNSNQESEQSS